MILCARKFPPLRNEITAKKKKFHAVTIPLYAEIMRDSKKFSTLPICSD
jgi:hypothetical protein